MGSCMVHQGSDQGVRAWSGPGVRASSDQGSDQGVRAWSGRGPLWICCVGSAVYVLFQDFAMVYTNRSYYRKISEKTYTCPLPTSSPLPSATRRNHIKPRD